MPIPVIPIVLLSLGLFALTRRGGSKDEGEPAVEMELIPIPPGPPRPPLYPSPKPGRMCRTEGGRGAWDNNGVCKKFWIEGETDLAIAALAREEWERRGSPTFSNLCLAVEDPLGGEFAAPVDNPVMVEIVATSLERYYDVGKLWPPKEDNIDGDKRSPHWVWMSWASAMTAVKKELCGL